jgi:hypothetical protein
VNFTEFVQLVVVVLKTSTNLIMCFITLFRDPRRPNEEELKETLEHRVILQAKIFLPNNSESVVVVNTKSARGHNIKGVQDMLGCSLVPANNLTFFSEKHGSMSSIICKTQMQVSFDSSMRRLSVSRLTPACCCPLSLGQYRPN